LTSCTLSGFSKNFTCEDKLKTVKEKVAVIRPRENWRLNGFKTGLHSNPQIFFYTRAVSVPRNSQNAHYR